MMESDEAELEDFPEAPVGEDNQDTAMSTDSPATTDVSAAEPVQIEDQPKRKRGKRKVLKKSTKRDEKGYLGMRFLDCY